MIVLNIQGVVFTIFSHLFLFVCIVMKQVVFIPFLRTAPASAMGGWWLVAGDCRLQLQGCNTCSCSFSCTLHF